MFNFLNKDDGKQPYFDQILGMINAGIGTFTMGAHDVDSLAAEYMPKLISAIGEYQDKQGGNPLMLNFMLSDDKTYLIASVYKMQPDGGLDLLNSFPLNNITELLANIKNISTQDATATEIEPKAIAGPDTDNIIEPGQEPGSNDDSPGTGTNEGGTVDNSNGGHDGLPEKTNGVGAEAQP